MNSSVTRELGRQTGIGVVLITFVTLVTFTFSFLGTILCAAMFGMMVGFSKGWKWQFILISLLFPGLLLLSLYFSDSESIMSRNEGVGLAGVCFGTFWATYLATRGLFLIEGGTQTPAAATSNARCRQQRPRGAKTAWHDLQIEELQGAWFQETPPPAGQAGRKVIKVDHNELTMSLVSEHGETRVLAKGVLQVEKPAHA